MEKLCDPANIRRFCDHLARASETENGADLSNLLTVLKVIICGPPGERCQSFYLNKLSAERCVIGALRAKSTREALATNPGAVEKLMNLILTLPYLSDRMGRAVKYLLPCLKSLEVDRRKDFSRRMLMHSDASKFEVSTIEFCTRENPVELERTLIDWCTGKDDESDEPSSNWIKWSSESSQIFQTIVGIFNELLMRLNCKRKVVEVIKSFIERVTLVCDKNDVDFPSLYPYDVQLLVSILMLDTSTVQIPKFQDEVVQRFAALKNTNVNVALMLLTHFPKWDSFLMAAC